MAYQAVPGVTSRPYQPRWSQCQQAAARARPPASIRSAGEDHRDAFFLVKDPFSLFGKICRGASGRRIGKPGGTRDSTCTLTRTSSAMNERPAVSHPSSQRADRSVVKVMPGLVREASLLVGAAVRYSRGAAGASAGTWSRAVRSDQSTSAIRGSHACRAIAHRRLPPPPRRAWHGFTDRRSPPPSSLISREPA